MKMYFNLVTMICLAIVLYGVLLPTLFSAESDIAVVSAVIIMIISFPIFYKWIKLIFFKKNLPPKSMLILFLLIPMMMSCSKVPAGYVGVKVYLLGDKKGVDNEVLGVGRYWIGINEELYQYPVFQINYVFTASRDEGSPANEEFTFQTKEGMECSMDLGVSLKFEKGNVSKMFQTYRKGPEEIREIVVRNAIRDALNKVSGTMAVEDVYGAGKARLMDSVQSMIKSSLDSNGIIVTKLSLIGSIRLPPTVKAALNLKIEATQRAQQRENELREAEAAAKKAIAEAQGSAEANRIKNATLTPEILKWQGRNLRIRRQLSQDGMVLFLK